MTSDKHPHWTRIFGTAWDMLTELNPEAGGFLLDHETGTVYADDNLMALLGMHSTPGYDEMIHIIGHLRNKKLSNSEFCIGIAEENESFTAGVVRQVSTSVSIELPLYSQTELVVAMNESTAPSLFALIRIEIENSPVLSDANIYSALTTILSAAPKGTMLSLYNKSRYWLYIPNFIGDSVKMLERLRTAVENIPIGDSSRRLTFTAGCGADTSVISQRMETAEFAIYEAIASDSSKICVYNGEKYEQQKNEYDSMKRFLSLVDNNLFEYHFQPIVKASTGEIAAYEALMRSGQEIGMYPLEILEHASKFNRLYDIEKATINNTLGIISEEQDIFRDRKLFINSISAHMLTDSDWEQVEQKYGELMEKMVIELTEQTEISSDSIDEIRSRLEKSRIRLAIDDYGTGYSNTSNLLIYKPDYVKIDRSLISGIDSSPKMQKLVSGTIEFIHENGFAALAEGVETYEELKTMIQLGADYIQGYYISRPKPVLLHEISENVKEEIISINKEFAGNIDKVYHPAENETVNLAQISAEYYNTVFVETDNVVLEGSENTELNMSIIIKDGLSHKLTLRNAVFSTERDSAIISLGTDCCTEMVIEGNNKILNRGIYVPQSADLKITGDGSLFVLSEAVNSYCIGTDKLQSHGNISIDVTGKLTLETNGENTVALGGGKNQNNAAISIKGGDVRIKCSGNNCIGIGTFDGNSRIDISSCQCQIEISAPSSVGIGSVTGLTDISMQFLKIRFKLAGLNLSAVGSIENGEGRIVISNCDFTGVLNGRTVNAIGSRNGNVECIINDSKLNLHCEGSSVSCIGDMHGSGDINIKSTEMNFELMSFEGQPIISPDGRITIEKSMRNISVNG